MGHDSKFKMAAMPIYGRNSSNDFSKTTRQIRLIFCRKAYRAPPYIKQLFWLDHKQALSGWGKIGENDAKFPIHEPFELES